MITDDDDAATDDHRAMVVEVLCNDNDNDDDTDDDTEDDDDMMIVDDMLMIIIDDADDPTTDLLDLQSTCTPSSDMPLSVIGASRYARMRCGHGQVSDLLADTTRSPSDVLDGISVVVDTFTNTRSTRKLLALSAVMTEECMIDWLRHMVAYFGPEVLIDAGVVLLTASAFMELSQSEQIAYFNRCTVAVRTWFIDMHKKLKSNMHA